MAQTDDFNRANSVNIADSSHPWIERDSDAGNNSIVISGNRVKLDDVVAPGQSGAAYWNTGFTDKQYSKAKVVTGTAGGGTRSMSSVAVRIQPCSTPTASGFTCYALHILFFNGALNGEIEIHKFTTGGDTILATSTGAGLVFGNTVELRAVGTTITAHIGSAQILSVTDSTFTNGRPGIAKQNISATTLELDDWEGGSLGGATTGGLCGGVGRCVELSDKDKFNRSVLVAPSAFPWLETIEPDQPSPFSLLPLVNAQNQTFVEGTGFLRLASSLLTGLKLPRGHAVWSPARSNDHFSSAKWIASVGPNVAGVMPTSLAVRLTAGAGWNTQTGYVIRIDTIAASNACILYRLNGTTLTQIGIKVSLGAVLGDVFELSVSGSTLQVYKNVDKIIEVTDATYTTGKAGFVQMTTINWSGLGFSHQDAFQEFDEWSGGECGVSISSQSWCKN